jgi:3-isopropylmalate/(R)-2-methylmalate dehydratase small subunit
VLNDERFAGAEILVGGHTFGCGSSREHAPWALQAFGFKAIISTYFADIFRNNALKNGILPIMVDAETHEKLMDMAEELPQATVYVDLESQTITLPDDTTATFPIDDFAKTCLLEGIDEMGYLQKQLTAIESYEAEHPARVSTLAEG